MGRRPCRCYVVGYMDGKEWHPCTKKCEAFPDDAVCREASAPNGGALDGTAKITLRKDGAVLDAQECFFAGSARKAKAIYEEAFEKMAQEQDSAPMAPTASEAADGDRHVSVAAEKDGTADGSGTETEAETGSGTEAEVSAPRPVHAIAYTDGSYDSRTGRYGYGVLLEIGGKKQEFYGGAIDTTGGRQVPGEVRAAMLAIEKAIEAGCSSIEIRYDYQGIEMWADGLWKTNKPYTAKYSRKVQEYRRKIHVSFRHIRAHAGEPGNERADELAKKGAGLEDAHVTCATPGTPAVPAVPAASAAIRAGVSYGADAEIGEHVNPKCRKAIMDFRKKSRHSFKDFMALKTYGIDYYSRLGANELVKYAAEHSIDVSEALPGEKERFTAIRWMMRGLSADDAVHKVKVDAEVNLST